MMKLMVRIHGYWAECVGEVGAEGVRTMCAYTVEDGRWYLAIGDPELHSEGETRPGIYVDRDGGVGYVPWPDGDPGPCPVSREPLCREEQILNRAARSALLGLLPPAPPEAQPAPAWTCPAPVSSLSSVVPESQSEEELVRFEKHPEDSHMVAYVKECVNLSRISRREFNSHFSSQRDGYNLIYGLRTRRTMTWAYVEKWAEILGLEVRVIFVSPEEREDK